MSRITFFLQTAEYSRCKTNYPLPCTLSRRAFYEKKVMPKLDDFLGDLSPQEYLDPPVSHEFETWQDMIYMSEDDMVDVDINMGNQRKLQREIAGDRDEPCSPLLGPLSPDNGFEEEDSPISSRIESKKLEMEEPIRTKRRYRKRLPKDPHAPLRPKSDYVLFANSLRQDPEVSKLPFVDISKLVGQKWQGLVPEERVPWATSAAEQKTRYKEEVAIYQRTDSYHEHQARLRTTKLGRCKLGDGGDPHGTLTDTVSPGSTSTFLNPFADGSSSTGRSKESSVTMAAEENGDISRDKSATAFVSWPEQKTPLSCQSRVDRIYQNSFQFYLQGSYGSYGALSKPCKCRLLYE